MKIRHKFSLLVILLTVAIILLINFSYVRIVTRGADIFVEKFLKRQMSNILVDVPPENDINWDEMKEQSNRTIAASRELLYIAIYDAKTNELKMLSMDMERLSSLIDVSKNFDNPRSVIAGLQQKELSIEDAREIEIFAQSNPPSTQLRVAIGYIFPLSTGVRTFITIVAVTMVFIFTVIAAISSFLLAAGITRPIRKLAAAMQSVSEGELDTAVPVRSRDEIGQLAKSFNKMTYRLKEKTEELENLNQTLEERVRQGVEQLARRDEAEKQRLTREIKRAREVQMGLLPKSAPKIEGIDISGICHPASEVGGDFYDYIDLDNGRVCLALGDISGKGMRGAMNALMAYGMMHAQMRTYRSAATTISELNTAMHSRFAEATFTALSLGIIDTVSKEIQLCNAGNPYPILLRDGKASLLELSGMPLGIISEIEYDETSFVLIPGDVIVFYSDGISEAMTTDERLYGMEGLRRLVETLNPDLDARRVVERVLQDVKTFVGDAPQNDDTTVIALRAHKIV